MLTLKLWEAAAGAREAATEKAPQKSVVKTPTAKQIREAEKRAGSEGMQRGNGRSNEGWGDTIAIAKNYGLSLGLRKTPTFQSLWSQSLKINTAVVVYSKYSNL